MGIHVKCVEAEVSLDCLKAHAGRVTATVDDAIKAVFPDLERAVTALAQRKFPRGSTVKIKVYVDRALK